MPGFVRVIKVLSKADFDTRLSAVRAALIDNLDVLLSTRLSKADFDALIGTRLDDPDIATLFSAINALGMTFLSASEITPGNNETVALEVLQSDDPKYEFQKIEAYTDLSPMQAGDTVVIKEYVAILATPLTYRLYATHTYSDAQTEPLVHYTPKQTHAAWRVTLQQTAGVNKEFRSVAYARRIY